MTSRWSPRVWALTTVVAVLTLALLLRCVPPSHTPIFLCPVHQFLGILCPGCGGTRAAVALVAGQWDEAFRQNPFVVALSPVAMTYAALQAYSAIRWNRWHALRASPRTLSFMLVAVGLFAVARNVTVLFR